MYSTLIILPIKSVLSLGNAGKTASKSVVYLVIDNLGFKLWYIRSYHKRKLGMKLHSLSCNKGMNCRYVNHSMYLCEL